MRKYIGVMLCCFFLAVALIPGAYSLWQQDLGVMGYVQISADKQKQGKAKMESREQEACLESNFADKENNCLENSEAVGKVEKAEEIEEADEAVETDTREDSGAIAGE